MHTRGMLIAWTSIGSEQEAKTLAMSLVEANLAACVQIDGPVRSFYKWEGKLENCEEFRLTVKFIESKSAAIEGHILRHHPYETPEWVVVRVEHVVEKYLSWAVAVSTSSTL